MLAKVQGQGVVLRRVLELQIVREISYSEGPERDDIGAALPLWKCDFRGCRELLNVDS